MSLKLAAVCPVCPMTFTAKHRQQIREMIDDHLVAHYAVLEDVKRDKEAIQRVKDMHEKTIDENCNCCAVSFPCATIKTLEGVEQ